MCILKREGSARQLLVMIDQIDHVHLHREKKSQEDSSNNQKDGMALEL